MQTQSQTLKISISDLDYLILSTTGARIMKLVLAGITVIEAIQPLFDLGSGNYLMYPWVSRLEKARPQYQPVFTAGNGMPVHGIVVNASMILTQKISQSQIIVQAKPAQQVPHLPAFTQAFTLSANKLKVNMSVEGQSQLPFCFGYHPYFQISNEKLCNLQFTTNLSKNLKLDQTTLLPVIPFIETQKSIISSNKYDHLFRYTGDGPVFFRIGKNMGQEGEKGPTLEISSSDMRYWQIYTPQDGFRIAVEPMTFFGNLFQVYKKEEFGELPREGTFSITII